MRLLALETATRTASVAVVEGTGLADARVLAEREREVATHSDVLLALIDDVLREAGAALAELGGVAVGAGPGSFTGLRIGLATAKGLCFAAGKPLYAVSTLAALALQAGAHGDVAVVPVLDAKKGEVYAGAYRVANDRAPVALADERALPPEALADYVAALDRRAAVLGTGVEAYPDEISARLDVIANTRSTPTAAAVARLALAADEADLAGVAPSYCRLSEAELNWRPR